MWLDAPSANSKRQELEFAKNREEFRELKSWRKRGAKADADRLVSRTITIAIVHFETSAFRKSESRNATAVSAWQKTFLNEGDGKQTLGRSSSSKQTGWFSAEYVTEVTSGIFAEISSLKNSDIHIYIYTHLFYTFNLFFL